ncbi:MAG: DNA-3-methyladenine glycosylase 2 family protein [Saprospiraceae bacterium]
MQYVKVLKKDPKMAKLLKLIPQEDINRLGNSGKLRAHLIQSIVSQQLSIKVAPIIFQRFKDLYGGKIPTNKQINDTSIEQLRSCGLSNQKSNYIKNIAEYFEKHKLKDSHFKTKTDEEIIFQLCEIKGVGKWTVEMVLMFCLGRENVFSVGDYGIQMAMKEIYNIRKEKKELEKKMLQISEQWHPYRSMACMYLWASKDLKIKI